MVIFKYKQQYVRVHVCVYMSLTFPYYQTILLIARRT